jgi:hypothetical protein
MKELNERTKLILWDAALAIGILLFIFWKVSSQNNLIIGFLTVMLLSTCIQKHIAAYKLTGKIY